VGHAAVLARCREISDDVFLVAAEALAGMSGREELARGLLFPRFSAVREVSARLMAACADFMVRVWRGEGGVARLAAYSAALSAHPVALWLGAERSPFGTVAGRQACARCTPPSALQVRTGLGSIPADFDQAVRSPRGLPTSASNLARWEAYATAHMFDPSAARL
jgi:hypothetical protein